MTVNVYDSIQQSMTTCTEYVHITYQCMCTIMLASISRLSPSTRTNCSVTFGQRSRYNLYAWSKVTLQFVRVEGESLEIEATIMLHSRYTHMYIHVATHRIVSYIHIYTL